MKMVLKPKSTCRQTSWVGQVLSSRMVLSQGREWSGMRQGKIMHITLGQVNHVDFYQGDVC